MAWRAALAAAALFFAPALAAAQTPVPVPAPAPAGEPIVLGTSHPLRSAVLGEERRINVRLPSGYNAAAAAERRYPVLYVLDGGVEQDFPHIAGLAQHGEISGTFDQFIVVGITTRNRIWELTTPSRDERYTTYMRNNGQPVDFAGGGGSERFRRHIAEEVIPFIDGAYRTTRGRTLIGESLAAFFVVDTLLRQPRLFDDYVAISPSLWWNREELANGAAALMRTQDFAGRRLYITMANEGGTMQRGLDTLVAALRSPAAGALRWVYVDRRSSEHHGSIYHLAALDALRELYPAPWRPGAPLPWLHVGDLPVLSAEAQADVRLPCTAERARKVTIAEIAADQAQWEAMCVVTPLGQAPAPRERSPNWTVRP